MQFSDEDFYYFRKIIGEKNDAIIKHLEQLQSDAAEQIIQLRGINARLDKMQKNAKRDLDISKEARRLAYDNKFNGYKRHVVLDLLNEQLSDRLFNSQIVKERDVIESVLIRIRRLEKMGQVLTVGKRED